MGLPEIESRRCSVAGALPAAKAIPVTTPLVPDEPLAVVELPLAAVELSVALENERLPLPLPLPDVVDCETVRWIVSAVAWA